mgnify:CR=1 FL=1|tara:strand:+ start:134 stop:304 length:171 start_codon:yes stop_codon:yes gene_type:complete
MANAAVIVNEDDHAALVKLLREAAAREKRSLADGGPVESLLESALNPQPINEVITI